MNDVSSAGMMVDYGGKAAEACPDLNGWVGNNIMQHTHCSIFLLTISIKVYQTIFQFVSSSSRENHFVKKEHLVFEQITNIYPY